MPVPYHQAEALICGKFDIAKVCRGCSTRIITVDHHRIAIDQINLAAEQLLKILCNIALPAEPNHPFEQLPLCTAIMRDLSVYGLGQLDPLALEDDQT